MAPSLDSTLTDETLAVLGRYREAVQAAERCAAALTDAEDPDAIRCARRCREVAALTATTARLTTRGAGWHPKLARICLDACLSCADACAEVDRDICRVTGEAMRACADACETMGSGGPIDEEPHGDPAAHGAPSPFPDAVEEDQR